MKKKLIVNSIIYHNMENGEMVKKEIITLGKMSNTFINKNLGKNILVNNVSTKELMVEFTDTELYKMYELKMKNEKGE